MPTSTVPTRTASARTTLATATSALRTWSPRRWGTAVGAAVVVGVVIGVPTVLIPNPWFGRDIPTEAWNYPVWIVVSLLTGMLVATYRRTDGTPEDRGADAGGDDREPRGSTATVDDGRSRRFGTFGTVLAWFAVGCPVCNKLALLAFGYSGAITWFAPAQPFLAVAAIVLTTWALVRRLEGEVSCPVPTTPERVS